MGKNRFFYKIFKCKKIEKLVKNDKANIFSCNLRGKNAFDLKKVLKKYILC